MLLRKGDRRRRSAAVRVVQCVQVDRTAVGTVVAAGAREVVAVDRAGEAGNTVRG